MRTYLRVTFSSEGEKPSKIWDALHSLGFKAQKGRHDFVYQWPHPEATVEEILAFGDLVHVALLGMGVHFEMETE